jgi:PadR family transcriptional regulator PadR
MFTVNSPLLDALVLAVCSKEDTYGYKITQDIREAIDISESTLYPVLRRLQKEDCLEVYDRENMGRNRRYYKITKKGEKQLELYLEEWKLYKERIDKVILGGIKQ